MTTTPIAILRKAADLGLKLSFIPPDTLDVKASGPWTKSFADTLRDHKPQLIALLKLPRSPRESSGVWPETRL